MDNAISGDLADMLSGLNLNELLRKQLKKDPLEALLHPDPADLAGQTAPAPSDSVSISEESLAAAKDMLKEFNTAKDYAKIALEAKRMDEASALEAMGADFNILDYVSEEMRDAVLEAKAKGALKKREDVYEASKANVKEMKKDIDQAAEEAATPKDAEGNPVETLGTASGAGETSVDVAPPPAPRPEEVAAQAELAPEQAVVARLTRVMPKLNITV